MKSTIASMLATFVLLIATPALAQESSRADFDELLKAMQGRWVGDVTWVADLPGIGKEGDKVRCYVENVVTEDGNAILSRFFGGNGSGTSIFFYDAASKEITQRIITSNGATWRRVFQKEDSNWSIVVSGSNSEGSKVKGKLFITVSDNGNKHSWSGATTTGGEPNAPLQDVWVRVSDK